MAIPFFTCGGVFYWFDRHNYAGWRIQENIWSRRCRLLDPFNVRRASGSFEICYEMMTYFLKAWETEIPSKEAVVLIHGLFQSVSSFERMSLYLKQEGYEVISFSSPQLNFDLAKSAKVLNEMLDRRGDIQKFHFIVHGIGGLILRRAIAFNPVWLQSMGRSVLIAVPNKGFIWAHHWQQNWLYKKIFGKMAGNIAPDFVAEHIPPMLGEFAVIMGGKEDSKGIFPFFFNRDNDGIVTVDEARHDGAKEEFLILNVPHFFAQRHIKIIEMCASFIKFGRLGKGKRIRKENNLMNVWN